MYQRFYPFLSGVLALLALAGINNNNNTITPKINYAVDCVVSAPCHESFHSSRDSRDRRGVVGVAACARKSAVVVECVGWSGSGGVWFHPHIAALG